MLINSKLKISIVLSIFNESNGIKYFWSSLLDELSLLENYIFEILWVNDGSTDKSQDRINDIVKNSKAKNINHIRIQLSKNFGHEAAMIAGIDNSSGEAILCMDADGQHPTQKIKDLINAYISGNQIILTERESRDDISLLKKILSNFFYQFLNYASPFEIKKNSSDFFLISKEISSILKKNFRDQNRFIRGFIQSIGYNKVTLKYKAENRLYGTSNYSVKNLFKLAIDAIFSFSNKPLRISIGISFVFILLTFILTIYTLYNYLFQNTAPSGYTTIIIFLSTSFSILFFSLGVISLYFEKLIKEIRKRPLYIISSIQ